MTGIDAHHHVWRLKDSPKDTPGPSPRPHDWLDTPAMEPVHRDFTLDDLAAETASTGIDRTILVQVLPDAEETAEFLTLAASSDLVAGVVGWADLTAEDVADSLDALRRGPGGELLVGIRHLVQAEADPAWLNRPDVRRGLGAVADANLVYDLLTVPHQLPAALATVRALPELTFVLDHVSKPPIASGELEPWAARVRELAAEPNVFCKLSGMVTEADCRTWTTDDLRPYADIVLDAFGPSRVMFGSDWPVCLLAASYRQVVRTTEELTSALSAAERAEVFGGTAARAYRLPLERLREEAP
ncbi:MULTISPECIES: amidohydrolase family protein [unclassified Streptomyces]|uniref:amidohydrolase family protein n=1 Tax=unclassified Streptomyces TaxID=2593676 RepID=UPI002473A701|nr:MULTISPECIES: amidohydrolase family protein [unclassified Streptomyces]MDH6455876.1 L-fuconolactonase [Streptomyces sp. SAI-119]MDH6502195.1 L-fuconolactonase [Streptomyces sp. SAI-149]